MPTTISQQKFLDSEEAASVRQVLHTMTDDLGYNTDASYAVNPDNSVSFVDKHMRYLCDHPKLNPQHYLANLRLMTRIKK